MFWKESWTLGTSFWRSGIALQETMIAAHGVIEQRGKTIDAAMRDPAGADVAELSRMVPEKVTAFGQAGMSLFEDWMTVQADMLAQGGDLATLITTSGPPANAALARIGRRSSRMAMRMGTAGERALAPVHAAVTANHRRLGRGKPKR